ncbi:Peptidylprolyl isomerase domain and WD repeat containing protein 1 [Chamberlinius hualienensis]
MAEEAQGEKRVAETSEDADEWIGPLPSEAVVTKKRKVLPFEQTYLDNLPKADAYEKSYMHRDIITHLVVTKTDFLITGSCDGHIKFWKKLNEGIEFVKHFRSHLGNIQSISANSVGTLFCSVSNDKSLKVFDVVNFDMINMLKLEFIPYCCEWIHTPGDTIAALAVSDVQSSKIYVYDGHGTSTPLQILERLHYQPVCLIKFNPVCEVVVSVDKSGMLEYWTGVKNDYKFPKNVEFDSKLDTDLYEFAKCKTHPTGLTFSASGSKFATMSPDRKIRIFRFKTGKMIKVFDESLPHISELQQTKQFIPNMEFGRRMAAERDLEKSEAFNYVNILFDESENFVLYATVLGVKVVNIHTNRCCLLIGKPENLRFLQIALFQGKPQKSKTAMSLELQASDNPVHENVSPDPTLFCTAFKKNRFYVFSQREPEDSKDADTDRDIFNEKPSKEDIISATEATVTQRLYNNCIIHTTSGDITCTLFAKECPKTVENFCVHSKNGYFSGHIFHRVIKGFMVQTGDPLGTGTGGESIWGGEFEDEFHPNLRHDRPYTLSMANAGPNTNGSQFFITVVPAPWLDNKHTVFGRVIRGMEVAQNISNVKTHPKTSKPYDDIRIVSITVK